MRTLIIGYILIALTACSEAVEPPTDLIDQSKFVEVLTEVQILEAGYTHEYINKVNPDSIMMPHYKEIFNRLGVDAAAFESSLHYYRQDEELIMEIYDEVINLITQKEDKIKKDHGLTIEEETK